MSKNLQNTIILKDVLKGYRDKNELSESTARIKFLRYLLWSRLPKIQIFTFELIKDGIVDDSSDGGIDSFVILVDDAPVTSIEELPGLQFNRDTHVEVYISQAKVAQSFNEKALDKLYITAPIIFDLDADERELWIRFNAKLVEKIVLLRKIWSIAVQKHITVEIRLSYACMANHVQVNNAVESKKTQIRRAIEEKTVRACKVSFRFVARRS